MDAAIGAPAPDFSLLDQHRNRVTRESLEGRPALVVFIPYPFTGVCDSELCALRDNTGDLGDLDANVVVVTTHAVPTNRQWADAYDVGLPVLSDYWPHGETSRAYGTFNERLGIAERTSYVLDADGVVRAVVVSEDLGTARPYEEYEAALAEL